MDREPKHGFFRRLCGGTEYTRRSVRELVDALMSNTYPGFNSQEPEKADMTTK